MSLWIFWNERAGTEQGVWSILRCCCSSSLLQAFCAGFCTKSAADVPKSPCQFPSVHPDVPFIPKTRHGQRHQGHTLHVPNVQRLGRNVVVKWESGLKGTVMLTHQLCALGSWSFDCLPQDTITRGWTCWSPVVSRVRLTNLHKSHLFWFFQNINWYGKRSRIGSDYTGAHIEKTSTITSVNTQMWQIYTEYIKKSHGSRCIFRCPHM